MRRACNWPRSARKRGAPGGRSAQGRAALGRRELRRSAQGPRRADRQLCAGEPLDAFPPAALALDLDRLPDQLQALADEISQLDADRGELNQALGREQQALKQMDGSSRAAEAAEQAEELKARLALDVEEYARLRLAAVVLHEAIDRYRQRSQGPVLDRASGLFAQLTLGSFQGLKVDYDDQDQAVLQAVRPGGTETVGIAGPERGIGRSALPGPSPRQPGNLPRKPRADSPDRR